MNTKSRRFFQIASGILILFALVHSIPHFSDPTTRMDEEGRQLWHAMQNYSRDFGGLERTFIDFLVGYSWYLMIFMVFIGIQNFLIIGTFPDRHAFIRKWTIMNLGMLAILAGITLRYFIYPPFIFFALSWIFFLLSLITNKPSHEKN